MLFTAQVYFWNQVCHIKPIIWLKLLFQLNLQISSLLQLNRLHFVYHNVTSQTNQLSHEIQAFITFQRAVPKMTTETPNKWTNKEVETSTFSNSLIFGTTTEIQHETNLACTIYRATRLQQNRKELPSSAQISQTEIISPVLSKLTTNTRDHAC